MFKQTLLCVAVLRLILFIQGVVLPVTGLYYSLKRRKKRSSSNYLKDKKITRRWSGARALRRKGKVAARQRGAMTDPEEKETRLYRYILFFKREIDREKGE